MNRCLSRSALGLVTLPLIAVALALTSQAQTPTPTPTQPAQNPSATPAADAPAPQRQPASTPEIVKMINEARYDQALQNLDLLASQSPEPPGTERMRGSIFYQEEKFGDADAAFSKALKQDPEDHTAIEMEGMVLFRTGRPAEAIPYLLKANTWLPDVNADANYVLGLAYLQTKRYEEARRSFAAVYNFPPDSASSYLLSARLLLRNEFLPTSRSYARRAIELDPKIPLAHQVLGEIALAEGNADEAVNELQQERASNPLNPAAYDRLGDAWLRLGKLDEAQKALNQAILLDPYSTGPLILLGKLLLKRGDANLAATFLRRAVSMDPENYQSHTLLGQAYRAMGRRPEALKEYQAAEKVQEEKK